MSTCRICKATYQKARMEQIVCSIACARRIPIDARNTIRAAEKADRAKTKARREAVKTRSDWIKDAQREFNTYIRLRDAGRACICCGQPLGVSEVGGKYDCGHYRSVGSAPHLRFDERNAHGQNKQCNRYGAGRAVDYRRGLIARLGAETVDALEADQATRKYSIDDLKAIRDKYRQMAKELTK